jgi:hypothetical protein
VNAKIRGISTRAIKNFTTYCPGIISPRCGTTLQKASPIKITVSIS